MIGQAAGIAAALRVEQVIFPYASLNPRMTVRELVTEPWQVHPGVVARDNWESELAKLLERVFAEVDTDVIPK